MEQPAVSVAVMNDYPLVVAGLARLLEPFDDRVRVVETEAGGLPAEPVDVVLYDTFAARHGGEVAYRDILATSGARHLAVYCWLLRPDVVEASLAQGASGYLSKQLPADELVAAIEKVAGGEVVVAGTYDEEAPPEWTSNDWPGKTEGLSEREAEVVAWIAQGLRNDEVADRVFLSINTIKSHIRTAYRKMGVETRSQAVLWAVEHGMRPPSGPDVADGP